MEGIIMLDGKKTYISALVLALATLVRALDWVTQEQYELILGLNRFRRPGGLAGRGVQALRVSS
jgi:hypothetical protein